ncbi:MAG: aminotransferase class I/II-fold pyridoxal phosphate-dependent enzyme, partial [Alphaproteobacteria bacterium]
MNEIVTNVLGRPERLAAPLRAAISALQPQLIADVSKLAFGDPKVIPLWFGESDLPTPEFIRRAAKEALDRGETFYTHTRGIEPLRQALADYMSGLYRRPVDAARVSVTTAGMNAIMLMMQLVLEAGDNAVMV